MLCAGFANIGKVIDVLATQKTQLISPGRDNALVILDAGALCSAAVTTLCDTAAALDTSVHQNVVTGTRRLTCTILVDVLLCCQLIAFRFTPSTTDGSKAQCLGCRCSASRQTRPTQPSIPPGSVMSSNPCIYKDYGGRETIQSAD